MNFLLVDFDDSFTNNIASEITSQNSRCTVRSWRDLLPLSLEDYREELSLYSGTILGPGPGHPEEYRALTPFIRHLILEQTNPCVGICLGHQLIWSTLGVEVKLDPHPVHGHTVSFNIPEWLDFFPSSLIGKTIEVQRYNSLYIPYGKAKSILARAKLSQQKGQLMASSWDHILSFQFHPESIGTQHRSDFFRWAKGAHIDD